MHAVQAATGSILVFSDVATILQPDALRNIVRNFQEPQIGCVSSEDRFIDRDGHVSGEGLYVKYEMFIRKLESRVNTLVGLSGSFFAARKIVCKNWANDLQSDFNTLLNSIKLGLRGFSDPSSIGYYQNIADEKKEFDRKVRTVLRGISVLMRNLSLLDFRKYGMFSWQLFSHKLCRWCVPFFLLFALIANISLLSDDGVLYVVSLLTMLIFYLLSLLYYLLYVNAKSQKFTFRYQPFVNRHQALLQLSRIAYYFTIVNISILHAWFKFSFGQRATTWEPSKR
jgi:hypothetical protein